MFKKLLQLANKPTALFKAVPEDLIALIARIAIAAVFWRSAQTKISGWEFLDQSWQFYNLNRSTLMLFEYEYQLPLIHYQFAAYMATFSEFFVSLAILLGFMTRLSAFALLMMTLVIQVLVYPDAWPTHILWATILLYIMKQGPGKFSVDQLLMGSDRP
ncbi:MAG: DoxX family protein [Gammaproteobacteria bacterium]|nr:MAG: DoxX family protein [Gammaproteobacteria bacterium]